MAFPKWLFITQDKGNSAEDKWFGVHKDQIEAVEDDSAIDNRIATYRLVKVNRMALVKTVKFVNPKPRKRSTR